MKKILFLFIATNVAACSTVPVSVNNARLIPSERIYQPTYFTKKSDDQAKVTITRDKGFAGSGCSHDIYANNVKMFSIRAGEIANIYLKPDDYIFRLETGRGVCPNIVISEDVILKPKMNVEYRILLPSDMDLRLTRMK